MATNTNSKLDLTWVIYAAYTVLIACSLDALPMSMFSPAKWVVVGLLWFLNIFLVLGVGMMFLALKKAKESHNVTMTVNSKEQKKWSWVLLLEICVVYFLVKGPHGEQLAMLASLVASKVVLTVIFLALHYRLRKYIPTKVN